MVAKVGYREALVSIDGVTPLVRLLKEPDKPATLYAAQALAALASTPSCRPAVRCEHYSMASADVQLIDTEVH